MITKEELKKEIQKAVKAGNAVLGYRKSLELIQNGNPKLIVISNNIPEDKIDEIEHNIKVSSANVEEFGSDSKELGLVCGKPFPVLVLVIKE